MTSDGSSGRVWRKSTAAPDVGEPRVWRAIPVSHDFDKPRVWTAQGRQAVAVEKNERYAMKEVSTSLPKRAPDSTRKGYVANVFEKSGASFTRTRQGPLQLDEDMIAETSHISPAYASPSGKSDTFHTPQSVDAEKASLAWELLEGVQPFSDEVQSSTRLKELTSKASRLSVDVFGEDALLMVTRKAKWQLNIVANLDDRRPRLLGFIVYKLRPELQSLSIAKVAVMPAYRQQGHGARLVESCLGLAQQRPDISHLALSALPEAVSFYERLGFRSCEVALAADDATLVEGQVYMERPVKGRPARRKSRK